MNKSVTIFLAAIVIFLAILLIFFFIDREKEAELEETGVEVMQQEEQEVIVDDMDEILGEQAEQDTFELPSDEFIQCLADSEMVVYASKTCPACTALADLFGGYEAVEGLFVFCGDDWDTCEAQMQTNYVPEIQYKGEVFEGGRSMEAFAGLTGCEL